MPYLHEVSVDPAHIDELGHAGNLEYLRWVLEAALAHSTALGLDQAAYLSRGQVWVVRRHAIDYLRPALAGDLLRVETRVVSMSGASSERRTRILRQADGALLARAATDWVYVDLARGRPLRVPGDVRTRFPLESPEDP
ncbi:MAG: thioesterase family protein [Myxococcales bacterium]